MRNKKRTRQFGIRLSDKEYERLQNYMERTELNASELFRIFINENPIKEIHDKDIKHLVEELRQVKKSLDYFAEVARTLDKNSSEEIAELRKAYRELARYIKTLIT